MPGEVTDRRIWTGGSSRGLSAARPCRLVDVDCSGPRSRGLACTALSSIKQVVRLSHNFIVHFSPTEGHGATQNQQVSSGKRDQEHTEDVQQLERKRCGALLSSGSYHHWKCWGSVCKLHAITHMPAGCSVAQHPKRHETKGRRAKCKASTSHWSCLESGGSSDARKAKCSPSFCPSPGFTLQRLLLIPTHHQSWLSREERERSAADVWRSILCFCLSPPIRTLHAGMESKFTTGLEVQSWCGWRSSVMKEAQSVCSDGREGERSFTLSPRSPPDSSSCLFMLAWYWTETCF